MTVGCSLSRFLGTILVLFSIESVLRLLHVAVACHRGLAFCAAKVPIIKSRCTVHISVCFPHHTTFGYFLRDAFSLTSDLQLSVCVGVWFVTNIVICAA